MELILTHDHSDFDAVAALLAAHRLIPAALPVLTRRQNRAVRAFLALYGDQLPFIQQSDLPREAIERVILVDTVSLPSLRGLDESTPVTVIDHHPHEGGLPPHWQLSIEPLGAATTLLVERLRATATPLTPIDLTLMLTGIFEDTGSLTFGTTTARDAYAAAWLIEQGALIDVARSFLHAPLSVEQRALYERLLNSAESLDLNGQRVVIATGAAADSQDEIAIVAHKLRDLLECAALVMLVDLGTHIQLVARSSVDSIDVGAIARGFGGGGHGRAAAAMIREMSMAEARAAVIAALHQLEQPGPRVADLMSHGVKTISHDSRVRDANRLMRRYGFEGFPVLRDGELVGLLTRRAVDRAMDHGLDGLRVSQVMEAGSVSVTPEDSLGHLQHLMMNSGWGQVPVVDSLGRLLGVVTRTDLVRQLGHLNRPAPDEQPDYSDLLARQLPPLLNALVHFAGEEAAARGLDLYAVGGFVRDLLLGQPNTDIDFVVEGDAISLTVALRRRFGGEVRSHERFGTGKWLLDHQAWEAIGRAAALPAEGLDRLPAHIDFASARTEFYESPTVLPEVERGSIKLDLHRRDFTINTLALRLTPGEFGRIRDYYNGVADLKAGIIRVLHSLSFVDDPTRILRAVRFEQRFGFRIEARTLELLHDALPLLHRLSADRLRHEFDLYLRESQPERLLGRLAHLGALRALHPALTWAEGQLSAWLALEAAQRAPLWPELEQADLAAARMICWLNGLSSAAIEELAAFFNLRRALLDGALATQRLVQRFDTLSRALMPSEIAFLLDEFNQDDVLLSAWALAPFRELRDAIRRYAAELRHVRPSTSGADLIALGLQPGPDFSIILEHLRAARLDSLVTNDNEERAMLHRLVEATPGRSPLAQPRKRVQ